MLTPTDRTIAQALKRRMIDVVPLLEFRVYGSRARGEATGESDFDVYILVETLTATQRQQLEEIAWEIGFEHDRIIAPIVVTRHQLEHGAFGANPLHFTIEREGIVV